MRIVDIDIKPGSLPNSINLKSRGVIPVAILSDGDFDATDVDPDTVLFAGASLRRSAIEDVDNDRDDDLILHVRTQETHIEDSATEACLTGQTFGGQAIQGCDSVRIVGVAADGDADAWGDAVEASVRTDQLRACPRNPKHDAWPPDINNDGQANLIDVGLFQGRLQTVLGQAGYEERMDLLFDGEVNMQDLLVLKPYFGKSCSEANPDADGDGFLNEEEMFIGTNALASCGVLAWPPDFDDDRTINLFDLLTIKPHWNAVSPGPQYSARHDLTTDGAVNLFDLLLVKPHWLTTCG